MGTYPYRLHYCNKETLLFPYAHKTVTQLKFLYSNPDCFERKTGPASAVRGCIQDRLKQIEYGVILVLYGDNGKENGNYYNRLYRV